MRYLLLLPSYDDRTIVPKTAFKEISAGQWMFVLIVAQIIRDISLSVKRAKIITSKAR